MTGGRSRFLKYRNYFIGLAVEISAIALIMLVAFFLGALLVRF